MAAAGPDPPHTSADCAEELLATKLYPPRPRPEFVSRPRLLAELDRGLHRGLILLSASPGFGKTSLLADWARRNTRAVAWLSLDTGDNDPSRFWRYVTAALDPVRPGLAERIGPLLDQPGAAHLDAVVTTIINELADGPDVLLILDDYHLIKSAAIHTAVIDVLEHRPAGLHPVLAVRADPPLPLARLRARGQLAELRDADLRFTDAEALALLRDQVGPDISADAVEALRSRTEGWVAGLQLAALSLRGRRDVEHFVTAFSGTHRYVLDYLTEEVLEQQAPAVREFLLETCVLNRLSGGLCDAVTGRPGGQQMLESIERANLFLVPLDDVRGWWRYHHLFADLLRMRLHQERPDRVPLLHHHASDWYAQRGLGDEAVDHALAADDADRAGQLVERYVDERLQRSEGITVEKWLTTLPPELVGARPRLSLARALLALINGRVEAADGPLSAAERTLAADPHTAASPYEPSVGLPASLFANLPAAIAFQRAFLSELRGDADEATSYGRQALTALGTAGTRTTLGAITLLHLGVAEWLRGQLAEAEKLFAAGIVRLRSSDQPFLAARVGASLGLVQRAQGRLAAARATYEHIIETNRSGGLRLPAAGIGYVGLAELDYEADDLDAALDHLTEGITLCRQLAYTQPLATGLATLAWIRHATGDERSANDAMTEAVRAAPGTGVASLLNPVGAAHARMLLVRGDLDAVARWLDDRAISVEDEPTYQQAPDYLVLVRLLIAQHRTGTALRLLDRLRTLAEKHHRTGDLIGLQSLHAIALAADGQQARATNELAKGISAAHRRGYLRTFVDEGPAMQAITAQLATRADTAIPRRYLVTILHAFDGGDPAQPNATTLIAPLSRREAEVLQLLSLGRRNREIADELVVELSTVKKHVTHILDKLAVTNRTQAIVRARELGLLP